MLLDENCTGPIGNLTLLPKEDGVEGNRILKVPLLMAEEGALQLLELG